MSYKYINMNANDVHNVAKALSEEEFYPLYALLKKDVSVLPKPSKRKKLPDFTVEDALQLLIKNHIK